MTTEQYQRLSELTFDALEELQKRTHVGGDKAAAALALVRAGLGAILGAKSGAISLDELEAEIEKLRTGVAGNDATIDAEADAKFRSDR